MRIRCGEQPGRNRSRIGIQLLRCRSSFRRCCIVDAADDIAYGVHDLEDAITIGLVTKEALASALENKCGSFLDALKEKYPNETENDVFSKVVEDLFGALRSGNTASTA